jgi:hypothetical protein
MTYVVTSKGLSRAPTRCDPSAERHVPKGINIIEPMHNRITAQNGITAALETSRRTHMLHHPRPDYLKSKRRAATITRQNRVVSREMIV